MNQNKNEIANIKQIMDMIPHRYPILLVDRLIEFEAGVRAVGLKNVTMNEPHFMGHFPGEPIMPGVLIVEAMAQTAALMVVKTLGDAAQDKLVYFMTIDNTKFRRMVTPGDTLHIHVETIQNRGPVWKFSGKAMVDGVVCAQSVFSAMIADRT
jgi:3-hydroxyacyl-[acyl-carrier-protein] dehydratase